MALSVGQADTSILEKFGNVNRDAQNNAMAQQAANIDLNNKKNLYSTQVMLAAAASKNPAMIAAAKSHLIDNNIDPSQWSDDPSVLQDQASAAKMALLNPYQTATIQQAQIGNQLKILDAGPSAAQYKQPVLGMPGTQPAAMVANMPAQSFTPAATPLSDASDPGTPGQINVNIPKPTQVAAIDGPAPAVDISQVRTQSPIIQSQVPQYQPTPQIISGPNAESNDTYAKRQARELEQFKLNNAGALKQQETQAEAIGKGIGDTTVKAGTATALSDRVMQGLDALDTINESGKLPYSGNIISPATQVAISNTLGSNPIANKLGINQDAADASQAFTKANKQQVIVGLQDMLAAAPQGSRLSRQLLALVDDANGIDTNASQKSIRNQIGILRNEVKNIGISENNTLENLTGGKQEPYNVIPVETPAPNAQSIGNMPASTGGKNQFQGFKYLGKVQ